MDTIAALENDYWKPLHQYPGNMIARVYDLRSKKLDELTTEDLRLLISQQVALPIVLPIALQELQRNIGAEGDMYEGDLLNTLLNVDMDKWNGLARLKEQFRIILEQHKSEIVLLADERLSNEKEVTKLMDRFLIV